MKAIQRLRESGIDVSYFRGLVMEAETERQANQREGRVGPKRIGSLTGTALTPRK